MTTYYHNIPADHVKPAPILKQFNGVASWNGVERGFAPFINSLPSPLHKGRGIKGEGLISNLGYTHLTGSLAHVIFRQVTKRWTLAG